jgi:hypothetical protein
MVIIHIIRKVGVKRIDPHLADTSANHLKQFVGASIVLNKLIEYSQNVQGGPEVRPVPFYFGVW